MAGLSPEPVSQTLEEALQKYNIALEGYQHEMLRDYCELLWQWNARMNLTRHTNYDRFVSRDLVDTLELADRIETGVEVLDFGTGGGVPGVPLSIIRPDLQISLCESVGKKASAVDAIVQKIGLPVPVMNTRVEKLLEDLSYDILVCRAVGPLWKLGLWLQPHWHLFGQLLVIKGPNWTEERKEARHRGYMQNVKLRKIHSYPMIGTESESYILKLWSAMKEEPSHVL
ncbi:MAG: 16S rRNA (guanine(527)-N(7))-methyltransferase RsmG [Planctomycetaceae bacterium]|nr:16S rRNA (guanine(527)-N(7))-methyltransferase RsmG [Planctomycetaceae bacterium]